VSTRPIAAILWAAVSLALAAPACAFAQTAGATPPPAPSGMTGGMSQEAGADQSYILGPGDVIEAAILGRTDFDTRARIGTDGKVELPYLGSVDAANRTTLELTDQVRKALESGGFFSHPILKIDIVSYASRYVIVLGDVHSPGLVPVDRAYRLSEILARVGGVAAGAADYIVLTPQNGPSRHLPIKALATGDSNEDPYVSPGDKIYSPDAELFFVSGQVKGPGTFPVEPDMTLRMAIARAGGITDLGSERRVKITRHGVKLDSVDLDATKIQPGDVIVVGERLF
jgi:polysaccharide export outer membrane protein